jgi:hypothetical protein
MYIFSVFPYKIVLFYQAVHANCPSAYSYAYDDAAGLHNCPGTQYPDKKEKTIFLICKKIQSGAVATSYMMKSFLIYEEMRKYFPHI